MVICSRVRAKDHARTFDTYEQWAIAEFAEADAGFEPEEARVEESRRRC